MALQGLNRRYRLEFGKALNLSNIEELEELQVFVPDRGLSVQSRILSTDTGHRIQFDIEKTASADQNKGSITLTNINDDMKGFIEASAGQEVYVKLEAATNQEPLKVIFLGTIVSLTDRFEGVDRITKLTLGDGYTPAKEAVSSVSFLANETYKSIIERLLVDMKLPTGIFDEPPLLMVAKAPWSYDGPTVDGLRRVAKEINYRFNITDGKVNFVDRHRVNLTEVAEYNERSGLIGSPAILDKSQGIKQGSSESPTGIRFKVLLDGNLTVDSLVIINSRDFEGTFRISKVNHSGDWRGNGWYTECEALKVTDVRNPALSFFDVGEFDEGGNPI